MRKILMFVLFCAVTIQAQMNMNKVIAYIQNHDIRIIALEAGVSFDTLAVSGGVSIGGNLEVDGDLYIGSGDFAAYDSRVVVNDTINGESGLYGRRGAFYQITKNISDDIDQRLWVQQNNLVIANGDTADWTADSTVSSIMLLGTDAALGNLGRIPMLVGVGSHISHWKTGGKGIGTVKVFNAELQPAIGSLGNVENGYGFFSKEPLGNIDSYYHFYGDGNYPSYLGGDLDVDGNINTDFNASSGYNRFNVTIDDSATVNGFGYVGTNMSLNLDIKDSDWEATNALNYGLTAFNSTFAIGKDYGTYGNTLRVIGSSSSIGLYENTGDTLPYSFASLSKIFAGASGNHIAKHFGYATEVSPWVNFTIDTAYSFYSNFNNTFNSGATVGQLYHFYGLGDYPSYFGGDLDVDGDVTISSIIESSGLFVVKQYGDTVYSASNNESHLYVDGEAYLTGDVSYARLGVLGNGATVTVDPINDKVTLDSDSVGIRGNLDVDGTVINFINMPSDSSGLATGDLWFNSSTGAIHRKF